GQPQRRHRRLGVIRLRILHPVVNPGAVGLRADAGEVEAVIALQREIFTLCEANLTGLFVFDLLRVDMTTHAADAVDDLLAAASITCAGLLPYATCRFIKEITDDGVNLS